jgi:hypothetical protein
MTGKTRGIGSVLAVLAAAAFVQAAERATDDAKPSPAASGKAASPAETYEDVHPIPAPSGGCCGGPKLVPVCRCVPTTKKKPKTEYDVKRDLRALCGGCTLRACQAYRSSRHALRLLRRYRVTRYQ